MRRSLKSPSVVLAVSTINLGVSMNIIWLAGRFNRRRDYGARIDDIIHARRLTPVRYRSGWTGTLGECDKAEQIVGIWLQAMKDEALSFHAESFFYDDKTDLQLDIECCRKTMAEYNMHVRRGPLTVVFDESAYLVRFV